LWARHRASEDDRSPVEGKSHLLKEHHKSSSVFNVTEREEGRKHGLRSAPAWAEEDDRKLFLFVHYFGNNNWSLVASAIGFASATDCYERYAALVVPDMQPWLYPITAQRQ
jgi:hypothetical protein